MNTVEVLLCFAAFEREHGRNGMSTELSSSVGCPDAMDETDQTINDITPRLTIKLLSGTVVLEIKGINETVCTATLTKSGPERPLEIQFKFEDAKDALCLLLVKLHDHYSNAPSDLFYFLANETISAEIKFTFRFSATIFFRTVCVVRSRSCDHSCRDISFIFGFPFYFFFGGFRIFFGFVVFH